MGLDVNYMRGVIKELYPGEKYAKKVDRMPYKQVMAFYMRITSQDVKDDIKKEVERAQNEGHQISMFEAYPEEVNGRRIFSKRVHRQ